MARLIEIDLHLTRDGAIVVAHDAELERLGGKGEIGGSTLAEIRSLDAGAGARVPTFEEVRNKIEARYAKAVATAELTEGNV